MTGFEIMYMIGAILVGYGVIVAAMVVAAIVCSVTDRINLPNWLYGVGKILFFILIIIFSIIFAYGMGDLVIQRFT
ncbi:MAG: hypothetical protein IJZ62_05980 [Clostridia bacterium]|nr:hypothetical protein [Clostridia bacterium]